MKLTKPDLFIDLEGHPSGAGQAKITKLLSLKSDNIYIVKS